MRLQSYIKEAVSKGYTFQLCTPAIKKLGKVRKNTTHERCFINKPDHGFWTSTLKGKNQSEWTEWARAERFGDISSGTVLKIQPGVSMYIIDNKSHYEKLLERFPYEDIYLDFVEISKVYDALYVTRNGVSKNHMKLYAWDVESTVWFNTDKLKIVGTVNPRER